MNWANEDTLFKVVINHEEQYSIWPADDTLPNGWKEAGLTATKQACLDYIDKNWTDMTPLSLRNKQ